MAKNRILFTSESVTEGHPDKMADQISDSILDAIMAEDPMGRVAAETLVTTGQVHVVGEISTNRRELRLRLQDLRHPRFHRRAVGGYRPRRR